jgi:hypothetical protein
VRRRRHSGKFMRKALQWIKIKVSRKNEGLMAMPTLPS